MARARVMSPPGTFETSTDVRYTAAFGGKATAGGLPLQISLWRGAFLATRFPARAPGNPEAGEPASAASALARLRGPKQGPTDAPGMRCRLSPTPDVPSHTSGAAMCHLET